MTIKSISHNTSTFVWEHATKADYRDSINRMLESRGYVIVKKNLKKFERFSKATLKDLYNMIRYDTNQEHIVNDLWLVYGLTLLED